MPIKKFIETSNVPAKVWTDEIEEEAIKQIKQCGSLPFVFKHVAVMADVHAGKGSTIGSVIATKGAIIPSFCGVDLGCGMMAVKTPLDAKLVQDNIIKIRASIERSIPLGFDRHNKIDKNECFDRNPSLWREWYNLINDGKLNRKLFNDANIQLDAMRQLGTLGGGNHFIEVCLDTENNVWIMLHSGSRGIGNKIATAHIDNAKGLMKKWFINLPDPDLAYLVQGSKEFDDYIEDIQWAQKFAFENRKRMMELVLKDISYAVGDGSLIPRLLEVNCHHNYVERENHYGENVLVTRKGAVRAREGEIGIIPGSMGAKSFIVKGRGNAESFCSCSHGAGRKMSRTRARALFSEADLAQQTAGIECRKDSGVVDEIPSAYKDIDKVMENQSDLVEIVAQLRQIMCVKG